MAANDASHGPEGNPQSSTDPGARTWKYTLKRVGDEFFRDGLIDRAAALTFYALLSLFPALIVLVSILGLVGQGEETTEAILGAVDDYVPHDVAELLREPISSITEHQAPGRSLVLSVLVALWAASRYVNAFGRAMNGIYDVSEGRPIWKRRPLMYLLTAVLIVFVAAVALLLLVSGPIARWVGGLVGLGETALIVWNVVRWPVLLTLVVLILAGLYYATPNVKVPKFRLLGHGAVVAIVMAAVATTGLALYVVNFGTYNPTYGALTGIVLFLVWLWVVNLAILTGAEIDAELERNRQLHAGLPAEEQLQLPVRDEREIDKANRRQAKRIREARAIRACAGGVAQDRGKTPAEPSQASPSPGGPP